MADAYDETARRFEIHIRIIYNVCADKYTGMGYNKKKLNRREKLNKKH